MKYLLDTNTLSALVRNPQGRVNQVIEQIGTENICTSIMIACELRYGISLRESPQLTYAVEGMLNRIEIVSFDAPADQYYARIRKQLRLAGTPIGANDLFIAAHALALGCTLVTDNVREFERVDGLLIENWLRAGP